MKKLIVCLLSLVLIFSLSIQAFANPNGRGTEYIEVLLNENQIHYESGNSHTWLANGTYDVDYNFNKDTGEFYYHVQDSNQPNISHSWNTIISPPEGYNFSQCESSYSSGGVNSQGASYDNLIFRIVITSLQNSEGEEIIIDPTDDPTVVPEDIEEPADPGPTDPGTNEDDPIDPTPTDLIPDDGEDPAPQSDDEEDLVQPNIEPDPNQPIVEPDTPDPNPSGNDPEPVIPDSEKPDPDPAPSYPYYPVYVIDIPDEEVPKIVAPKTGDNILAQVVITLMSSGGIGVLTLGKRKNLIF